MSLRPHLKGIMDREPIVGRVVEWLKPKNMPNHVPPLGVPWVQPSLFAGAIRGGDFGDNNHWGCQPGITEHMLCTFRLPAQRATHRVAEFHVIRTVNLGKWWRRLIEAAQAALVVLPR